MMTEKTLTSDDLLAFVDFLKRGEKAFDSLIKPQPKMITQNDANRDARDTVADIRKEFQKRFIG